MLLNHSKHFREVGRITDALQMTFSQVSKKRSAQNGLLPTWDIYVPFAIAVIPTVLFSLLGLVVHGLDKPGAAAATWVFIAMLVLQELGIFAMAFVILIRWDRGFKQLSLLTNGSPARWRKAALFCSIAFILLFDILTNIAVFANAGLLFILAVPAFIGYVLCLRVAFAKL